MSRIALFSLPLLLPALGCATTRLTDTPRSATEQLLLSDAVDSALGAIDLDGVAGRAVFLDVSHLADVADKEYVDAALRRKLARAAVRFSSTEEESEVVVKVGIGTLGTNRSESLIGIPQIAFPAGPIPAAIPELAIVKETRQRGVAKLFVFAYERSDGTLLADASSPIATSDYRAKWVLGTGPYESGSAALPPPLEDASSRADALDWANPLHRLYESGTDVSGHSVVEFSSGAN